MMTFICQDGKMDSDVHLYRIGGPFFTKHQPPYQEGVEFNYRNGSFTLTFSYPNLSPNELRDLEGECEFGVYSENGILFFLYRFGESFAWSDAPYSWWLVPDEDRSLPEGFAAETRILLHMFVVDSRKNQILQMRLVTVPTEVTKAIVQAIIDQTENYAPAPHKNHPKYTDRINKVWESKTSVDMARLGTIGKGGT